MKRIILLFCILGTACSFSNTRLMLLGDSITRGVKSANDLGLRDDLYDSIKAHGYPIDWVGSFGASPYGGHFRSGARICDFYTGPGGNGSFDVSYDLDTFQPNILMIHLGANDVVSSDQITPYSLDGGQHFHSVSVSGQLGHLISTLLQWKNSRRGNCIQYIFISKIIPRLDYLERVQALNEEIERMILDSEAGVIPEIPSGSLKLVDQYSAFNSSLMMSEDGIHPNEPGYVHMAGIYFDALESLPMSMAKISGDGQDIGIDSEMPDPLTARALNGKGKGVKGIPVVFQVQSGNAVLVGSANSVSDTAGNAHVRCRGTSAGVVNIAARGNVLFQQEVVFQGTVGLYASIDGTVVSTLTQAPIPGVRMQWVEEIGRENATNANGLYRLSHLPLGGTVTVKPVKVRDGNGIDGAIGTEDASLTASAAMGLTSLSPEERLAADTDGDGFISMFDAFQIARTAEGFRPVDPFRVGRWIFSPESRTFSLIDHDYHDQEFQGILVGDVRGRWQEVSIQSQSESPAFPSTEERETAQ